MSKILFPTDLSDTAMNAFVYALHWAKHLEATIVVLHVYEKPEVRSRGLSRTLSEFYETYELDQFQNYRDSIPMLRAAQEDNGFSDLKVEHTLRSSNYIAGAITEAAKEETVDLIVMGTTGERGIKELFLGSVAGEVLESAPCPVLAVPKAAQFDGHLDNIALSISYEEEEKEALRRVIALTALFRPTIHCVHVDLSHTAEYTNRMEVFAQEFQANDRVRFTVLDGNDLNAALDEFVRQQDVDLLAMVTHERNMLEELFSFSRAKEMSFYSDTPVLSVPASLL